MPPASLRDKPPDAPRADAPRADAPRADALRADAPRAYGPRGIGGLIARVTRPGFRRRSPAATQIMTDWMEIMGPDLGPRTVPQKISAGTLTIGCAGPVAMELQHLAPQLIARINGHVGGGHAGGRAGGEGDTGPVQRLRFVQQILPPQLGKAQVACDQRRPARPPRPPPRIDLEPGPLHDALARLAKAIDAGRG